MATVATMEVPSTKTSSMNSSFTVLLPEDSALFLPEAEFNEFIDTLSLKSNRELTLNEALEVLKLDGAADAKVLESLREDPLEFDARKRLCLSEGELPENRKYTQNHGYTNVSTLSPLLDLFVELEKTIEPERLKLLLQAAWKEDPVATLKIVWNARSIHLGKGEQNSFYRCLGWMSYEHPKTVLANLPWLIRPIIEKKAKQAEESKADMPVLVEKADLSAGSEFNVPNGLSHGYWKDLLNILILAANKSLNVMANPRDVIYMKNLGVTEDERVRILASFKTNIAAPDHEAQELASNKLLAKRLELNFRSRNLEIERNEMKFGIKRPSYEDIISLIESTPFYRALHLTVARIFADQLKKDMGLLESGKPKDLGKISLVAKWAPSLRGSHDKNTLIASSIAEILFPRSNFTEIEEPREMYLRRARESYRRFTLSPLRKALEIVERDISAQTFQNIDYEKVPSLAMNRYKDIFVEKDLDRFEKYIDDVAANKSRISGAVLTPASIMTQINSQIRSSYRKENGKKAAKNLLLEKTRAIEAKVLTAQWGSLVKRIKDNGKLSNSMAVCDVSGSMSGPVFDDGTCPMDTSLGLSLLIAEITEPPFGGSIITFSDNPALVSVGGVDDTRSLHDKVSAMRSGNIYMNTDFIAVFERLILPLAIEHKVKPENMVKQLFVFSDMQFDEVQPINGKADFDTDFERIQKLYKEAGYEVPRLIFWNLAGGYEYGDDGSRAPKPVVKDTANTMIVSGYSQALLKMFLDGGQYAEEEDEVVEQDLEGEEGYAEVNKKKRTLNPMDGLWKAIGHEAYSMLKVRD